MRDGLFDVLRVPIQRRAEFFAVGTPRDTAEHDGNEQCHRQPYRYANQYPGHTSFVALCPVKKLRKLLLDCCNPVLER